MKTIFITINRGIVVRNLLRNQFFKLISNDPSIHTVIFFSIIEGKASPPAYLREEFGRENVTVKFVKNTQMGVIKKLFNKFISRAVFSPTSKLYALHGTIKIEKKNVFSKLFWFILYPFFSKTRFSRKLIWWTEQHLFLARQYDAYFREYKPNLVLSTNILSDFDRTFLKTARRFGIKTIAIPKSWDNLDKYIIRSEPDLFLVQNEWMREEAVLYQKFRREKVIPFGFPQFDIYKDESLIESRREYCQRHSFDSTLPIIFIGSEGQWSVGDEKIYAELIEARDHNLIPPCNILIRPHFSEADLSRYDFLRTKPLMFVDDTYRKSDFFVDRWDPTHEDMKDFTNTLRHCSLSINFASTLALDAVFFDKPIINIAFGVRFKKNKDGTTRDVTPIIYETNYYRAVLATEATSLVYNFNELCQSIRTYLTNAEMKQYERNLLREKLCFNTDGKSGERLYKIIKDCIGVAYLRNNSREPTYAKA